MPDVMTSEQFFGMLDEIEREESGGGGYIGKIRFELGFKVYASGMQNDETWFPFSTSADKPDAKARAAKLAAETSTPGNKTKTQLAYGFWLIQDSVMNRDVSHWQGDRFWCYPHWTDAASKVIKPALQDCAIYGSPYEFYGRLTFIADPSGRTRTNQEGEQVAELVAFPAEKFASKEEAEKVAMGEMPKPSTGEPVPGATGVPDWLPEYAKDEAAKGKPAAVIAKEVDLDIGLVKQALEM